MGGAYGVLVAHRGVSVYHNGSADLIDAELAGKHADVLLVGLAGRQATPHYLSRLTEALGPRVIVPTHHDAFFAPLDRGVHLLPGIDLDGFVTAAAEYGRVITPSYGESLFIPLEDPRAAFLADLA
jgi:L-ascorbate metabolism protein UlaG (beta-lactamase superfamily)